MRGGCSHARSRAEKRCLDEEGHDERRVIFAGCSLTPTARKVREWEAKKKRKKGKMGDVTEQRKNMKEKRKCVMGDISKELDTITAMNAVREGRM